MTTSLKHFRKRFSLVIDKQTESHFFQHINSFLSIFYEWTRMRNFN